MTQVTPTDWADFSLRFGMQHEIRPKKNLAAFSTEKCIFRGKPQPVCVFRQTGIFSRTNFMPKKKPRNAEEFARKRSNAGSSSTSNFGRSAKNKQSKSFCQERAKVSSSLRREMEFISRKRIKQQRTAAYHREIRNIFFGSGKLSQSSARSVARSETFGKKNSRYLRAHERTEHKR